VIFPNPKCQELYDGWLLYTKPVNRWIQYPKSYERSAESRRAQIADTWALKRLQCDAVMASCRAKGCLERNACGLT
jgi:hypothetical protein